MYFVDVLSSKIRYILLSLLTKPTVETEAPDPRAIVDWTLVLRSNEERNITELTLVSTSKSTSIKIEFL